MNTGSMPTRPLLGLAIFLIVVGLLLVPEVAAQIEVDSETGILAAIVLVAAIGGFLVAKRPNHPVSWLMAGAALFGGFAGLSAEALPPGITELSGAEVVLASISGPTWFGLLVLIMVAIPLLFPTGAPPTPRWWWVLWSALAAWTVMSVVWVFQERYCTDLGDDGCITTAANPLGIEGLVNPEESALGAVLYVVLLVCSIAALVSLIVRYRRSAGVERQQIKWVLLSIGVFLLLTVAIDVIWIDLLGQPEPSGVFYFVDGMAWVMIPASVALAILRYRLYDLDRIISRTVAYALVIGLLGLIAFALVTLLTFFLPSDDPLVVAAATLFAAASFNPLRRRVQGVVDRRFNRSRFDAVRVVEQFAGSLQEKVDPDEVLADWSGVVAETMQPASVGVWVKE